jgi:hypothetical protein
VPSAAGVSFDPEAVMHLGVVAFAEQAGVLRFGLSAVEPVDEVDQMFEVYRRRSLRTS